MKSKNVVERFLEKTIPVPFSGCWLWTASLKHSGYGQFGYKGKSSEYAHRVAYELFVGPIPENMTLDHKCRVRCCVNPDHLEYVSLKENVLRGIGPTAVNALKTHCKRGHEFTEENTHIDTRNQRVCRICMNSPQRRAASAAYKRKRRLENPSYGR